MTRNTQIQIRLTEEEAAQIRAAATEVGLTASDFIRRRVLDQAVRVPRPKPEAKVALEDEKAKEPGPVARIFG